VTANAITAPNGTLTADKLVEDTSNNSHFVVNTAFTGTVATYSASIYAKAGERTWLNHRLWNGAVYSAEAYFDLTNGVVGTVVAGTATITPAGNGWYRCTVVGALTVAATCTIDPAIAEADNDRSYLGDGTSGLYLWGAQVELGAFASSYIPTTATSITRNQDDLSYVAAGNIDSTIGFAYAETQFIAINAASNNAVIGNAAGGTYALLSNGTDGNIVITDGTTPPIKTGLPSFVGTVRKVASTWGGSTKEITGNGVAVLSGAFDGSMGFTGITIGKQLTQSAWGTVRNVRIGTTQRSAAQLQAMTT
jgi:hypothetical protein